MMEYSHLSAFAEPIACYQSLVTFSLCLIEVKLHEVSFISLNFLRVVWFPVQDLYVQSTGRSVRARAVCSGFFTFWAFILSLLDIYTAHIQQEAAHLISVAAILMLSN